ncbi:energy transducer TonB [Aureisphaera sp. CAU 1614]|uniref:Energy transducer TonB n=1 Tax=Halomarinibacterium sedimenti TaxID=2857106 RepID=A0A9X1JWP1_9FLAO|nr:energy transducer TonB [Halomarinibacterium sedimenti]MAL59384.1 energy transducer TonB [Flavobacteriaceae bacterium]MBW2939080.1 energy transducer TonB [Halomarinibacterium sedimenti]HAT63589.1 energy transducer TonB [Flavobacteriaceae bacterium]
MKKLLVLLCMSVSVMGFSQEWGGVDKNTVTMKEVAPTWPGCESKSGAGTDACFKQKLAQHIGKNFKYPAEAWKNNEQGKVIVEFMITENGTVDIKNISGGTASLQEEAKRNIMLIPKMKKPGMLAGKPKAIKYTVPFDFKTGK